MEARMLKYSLRENYLTPDENDYMAQVTDSRSFSLDEIIDLMMQKGSTLTKADTKAVLQVYGEVIESLVKDGNAINTPLINTGFSMTGVFNGANDSFDDKRHSINLNITAGTLLNEALRKVKTEKVQAADTDPYITEVLDIVSGKVNTALTKGGIIQLTGSRLKFDTGDDVQGIFFIPETGETKKALIIAENKPARLMALIPPDLAEGTYYVEVRTKVGGNNQPTKKLKAGRFYKPLSCTA